MPRVRTREQLQLALDAPPRPEDKDAGGDKERWRELQRVWVAAWQGRLLELEASDKKWKEWWKQSKKQHKELLQAAADNKENTAESTRDAADEPPAKVAAVRVPGLDYLTTAWLRRRVPEVVSLQVSEPVEFGVGQGLREDAGKCRQLTAVLVGATGEEESRETTLTTYKDGDFGNGSSNRMREELAVLRLVKPVREAIEKAHAAAEAVRVPCPCPCLPCGCHPRAHASVESCAL